MDMNGRKMLVVVVEEDGNIRATELPDDSTETYDRVRGSVKRMQAAGKKIRCRMVSREQWECMVTDLAHEADLADGGENA